MDLLMTSLKCCHGVLEETISKTLSLRETNSSGAIKEAAFES